MQILVEEEIEASQNGSESTSAYDEQDMSSTIQQRNFVYRDATIFLEQGASNEKFQSHPTQENLKWYLVTHSTVYRILDLMAAVLLLALGFAEKPASGTLPEDNILGLQVAVHTGLEISALSVLAVGIAIKAKSQGLKNIYTHKRSVLKLATLIVMYVEAIVVVVRNENHVRVTRALRPLFLVDSFYLGGTRRTLRQILLSLPPIVDMLFLLLFFMVIFTMLGFYLFSSNQKDMYFTSFGRSFVSLFVLLTTANYPDVMMPSYAASRWSVIFFGIYLSFVLYFLMNLLLAVVYATFTNIEKEKFKRLFLHKRQAVRYAFGILCSKDPPHWITLKDFFGLMSFFKPKHTVLEKYLVFKSLNTRQNGALSLEEFYQVFESTEMTWRREIPGVDDRWFYFLKDKSYSFLYDVFRGIHWLVTRKAFEFVVYLIILLNAATLVVDIVALSGTSQAERGEVRTQIRWYHIVFLSLYGVEAILKIVGLGARAYFLSISNLFDFLVTVSGIIGSVVRGFSFTLCLRPLRLLLLFKLKQGYRDVLYTMADLITRMSRVALVILLIYYSFGIIGMECFSGLKLQNCCKNTSVEYAYADEGYYYLNNFDDLRHAYVTLFELTVVNNWFIIMEGIVYMTSDWSRVYFMSFYIVTMVVMTIVVAFILEAFLFRIQYRKEHPMEEEEDAGICTETSVTVEELERLDPSFANGLQPSQEVKFRGRRQKTKMDLSVKMFQDEIEQWIANERVVTVEDTLRDFEIVEDSQRISTLSSHGHSPTLLRVSHNGVGNGGAELEEIASGTTK